MQNRDKWIAVIFLIFIISLPIVTIVSDFLPKQGTELIDEIPEDKSETDSEKTWFVVMQDDLDSFTKRLLLRKSMIKVNKELTLAVTGGTNLGSTQVLIGKNNWLFFKTEGDGQPIKDYMGVNHFEYNELIEISVKLTEMRDYFREKGIDFYITVLPNKEIIYEENLPDTIMKVDEISRGEQLAQYIKEKTDLVYIYPKQALCDAKKEHQIYYTTDTHWNQKGAFIGMQEIFREAYGDYADLDSVNFFVHATDYVGDLAVIGDIEDKYAIDTVYAFDKASADKSQYRDETLLIVGDSFSEFLLVIAQGYYRDVHRVATDDFTMDMIAEYEPDVIIWEAVERRLDTFIDVNLITE